MPFVPALALWSVALRRGPVAHNRPVDFTGDLVIASDHLPDRYRHSRGVSGLAAWLLCLASEGFPRRLTTVQYFRLERIAIDRADPPCILKLEPIRRFWSIQPSE